MLVCEIWVVWVLFFLNGNIVLAKEIAEIWEH